MEEDGALLMCDPTGSTIFATHALRPGENPEVVAKQLGMKAWKAAYPETQWSRPFGMPQRPMPLGFGDAPV